MNYELEKKMNYELRITNYGKKLKNHNSSFIIHYSRYVLLVLFFVLAFFVTDNAHAGTIIKSPAYLGLNAGLVGCWNFDGDYTKAQDCSPNNNDGTLTGGTTKISGKIGQGLSFDASADYVDLGSITNGGLYDVTNLPWTMTAWVKWDGTNYDRGIFTFADTANHVTGLNISNQANDGDFRLSIDGGTQTTFHARCATNPVGNIWYHVVGTYDGAGIPQIYVNGALCDQGSGTTDYDLVNDDISIGIKDQTTANESWGGLIDEVRFYNRALSAAEISRLYRIGLGSTVNRPTSSLQNGLVGYWTFDGADVGSSGTIAKDRSGNNNNGTFYNSPSRVQGKVGQALSFNGVNQDVEIQNVSNDSLKVGGGNYTLSAWVKNSPSYGINQDGIVMALGYNSGCDYKLAIHRANDLYGFCTGDAITPAAGTGPLFDDTWQHVVGVVSGTTGSVYVNGVFSGSVTNLTPNNAHSTFVIGAWGYGAQVNPYPGSIDEVRVYNRALSVAEVQRLYQTTQGKFNSSKTGDVMTKGLVGHWTFDGADTHSSGKTDDKSGNGNTGTLTNGPTRISGKVGQALDFNESSNQCVNAASATILDNLASLTVSAWIKPRTTNQDRIVSKQGGADDGWSLELDSDNAILFNQDYDSQDLFKVVSALDLNTMVNVWTHVLATWDGSASAANIHIYINGVERASTGSQDGQTTRANDQNAVLMIGARSDTGGPFNGGIDEVRLYNRVLSAGEAMKLYQMGR